MAKQNVYLESKPRYEILDGLRGVAALMVVVFHLFETYADNAVDQVINHGFLAVDFFFVLSGFVVGYAYDDRWDRMTTWGFFKRRLTRLHPMLIVGTLIGACLFFFTDGAFPKVAETPAWKFFLCLVMGLFLIPCGPKLDIRGWNELNSFNGPAWTLMLEYIGNILYAFIFRHLPIFALAILCAVCAIFTLDLTLGWVLISRILPAHRTEDNPSGSPIRLRGGFWWCALALAAILAMPNIGGRQGVPDGLFQAISILVIFPLIVLTGAGSVTTHRFSTTVCKFLGDISYPIYITHYPLIYLQMGWVVKHEDAPLWLHVTVSACVFIFAILMAYGMLKAFDEPVREWLKDHWLKRKSAKA